MLHDPPEESHASDQALRLVVSYLSPSNEVGAELHSGVDVTEGQGYLLATAL